VAKHKNNERWISVEVEIKMPDLSTTEGEVKIIRWLVKVGQKVQRGQPLLEIETDKATMEMESLASGTLKKTCVQPDDTVPVGTVIAIVESE